MASMLVGTVGYEWAREHGRAKVGLCGEVADEPKAKEVVSWQARVKGAVVGEAELSSHNALEPVGAHLARSAGSSAPVPGTSQDGQRRDEVSSRIVDVAPATLHVNCQGIALGEPSQGFLLLDREEHALQDSPGGPVEEGALRHHGFLEEAADHGIQQSDLLGGENGVGYGHFDLVAMDIQLHVLSLAVVVVVGDEEDEGRDRPGAWANVSAIILEAAQ